MAEEGKAAEGMRRSAPRKHSAFRAAQQDQQWKIFSDLDSQDEAEMLQLAVFLQTLMDFVPGGTGGLSREESARQMARFDEEDEEEEGGIRVDTIQFHGGTQIQGDIQDFTLPKGSITPALAQQVVEVYRRGGRLSEKAVQKILRLTYRRLKTIPNTTRVNIGPGQRLTVVGDLHGQLPDLLHILDEAGMPSEQHILVFNGDFVDRGPQGVEVLCTLLALHAAQPESVILTRGNHEDHAICCVYGFQRECKEKFNADLIFGMFVEVFRYLPLFTIVNDDVFIVHGGLFHDEGVELAVLDQIDRTDYVPKPPVPYPQVLQGLDEEQRNGEYLKQLQRDALWSDPHAAMGMAPNPRGAGVVFGPDVCRRFLERNNLHMVVRSHECVRSGLDLPYSGDDAHLLATIFSASNYGGSGNDGAYLVFHTAPQANSAPVGRDGPGGASLHYQVFTFKTSDAAKSLESQNQTSLHGLVLKRRAQLLRGFEAADPDNTGVLPMARWAEIMSAETQLLIRWSATVGALVPEDCVQDNGVVYRRFLETFDLKVRSGTSGGGGEVMMDALYANRSKLEAIFHFFDTNGDGSISREEFARGCNVINQTLPPEQQLRDWDHILDLMDFDRSDSIDINEFMETFRIVDAKDGSLDGVIDLANGARGSA